MSETPRITCPGCWQRAEMCSCHFCAWCGKPNAVCTCVEKEGATMITEADIAGIQCPYEGRAVALALWNERVREAAKQAPQEEWDAGEVHCAACGDRPDACRCAPNG